MARIHPEHQRWLRRCATTSPGQATATWPGLRNARRVSLGSPECRRTRGSSGPRTDRTAGARPPSAAFVRESASRRHAVIGLNRDLPRLSRWPSWQIALLRDPKRRVADSGDPHGSMTCSVERRWLKQQVRLLDAGKMMGHLLFKGTSAYSANDVYRTEPEPSVDASRA